MASVTPAAPVERPDRDPEADTPPRRSWLPLAIWSGLIGALVIAVALVSITAISYRYNAFTQRTIREEDRRGVIAIWREQVGDLPSGGWLLDAVFVAAIVTVLLAAAWGAWLLLVSASERDASAAARPRRSGRA